MFMHDRRAPVIREVGFAELAGNLFFLGVEGEMLPDPGHFGREDDNSAAAISLFLQVISRYYLP